MRKELKPTDPEGLNMTPMIDVVFQLLIFFMLSMHFKEIEGKLITTIPRGPGFSDAHSPPDLDVRIHVCAGGDLRAHVADKGAHEKAIKDPAVCRTRVENIDFPDLHQTSRDESKRATNRAVYRDLAKRAKELHDMTPSMRDPSKRARVVIDACSEVPYEHLVGLVNALLEAGLTDAEFAANPRFGTTYGSDARDPFKR